VWVLLGQADAPSLPGWQVDLDVEYVWPLTFRIALGPAFRPRGLVVGASSALPE
jgi:hypothetical protein